MRKRTTSQQLSFSEMNSLDSPGSVTTVNSLESSENVTIMSSLESLGNVTNMNSSESSLDNVPSLPHELALPPTLLMSLVLLFYIPVGVHHYHDITMIILVIMMKEVWQKIVSCPAVVDDDIKKLSQIILTAATGSLLLIASVNILINMSHNLIKSNKINLTNRWISL